MLLKSHAERPNQGRIILVISIAFASYIAISYGFAIDLFSMVVPDIRQDLQFSYTAVGVISASTRAGFLGASLLCIVFFSRLCAGKVVLGSVIICMGCFLWIATAHNVWLVGIAMTIIGGCAATVYIPMVEIVGQYIPKKYHGRVIGFICGGQSLGVMGSSFIVPYTVSHHSWRWAWISVFAITLFSVGISVLFLKPIGVFSAVKSKSVKDTPEKISVLGDLKGIITRGTIIILALYFFSAFSYNPFQTYLSAFLREELYLMVSTAGFVWTCIAIPGIISGLLLGWIADRFGTATSLVIAYTATIIATLLFLHFYSSSVFLSISGLLFGLAYYSIFGLIPSYISKVHRPELAAKVFAIANVLHGVGGISGNFLGGWIKDKSGTFWWLYLLIIGVLVCLIVISFMLPKENTLK